MFDSARLSGLCRTLRQNAAKAEAGRRLPDASVRAMTRLGLFRALVPLAHGGLGATPSELFEPLVEMGRRCPSSAWVASLFAVHSVIVAWFPSLAQEAVWGAGPDARVGSSLAPMGNLDDDGNLSGRWSFSSGLAHADWLILGARQGEQSVLALIPASLAQVEDDWEVAGLAGSGSNSLTLDNVPVQHTLAMKDVEAGQTPGGRLHRSFVYRLPWRPLFSYAFVPPVLGAAQAALEEAQSLFGQRRSAFTGQAYNERNLAWSALAHSRGEADTALALMRTDLKDLEAAACAGRDDQALTLRASYNPALIAKLCRDAVNRLFHGSGASALYQSHPLQRHFRDIHAMGQHPALNFELAAETYGRALLSQEPSPAR